MQPGDRVDIRQPVLEAYGKTSDLPYYVFLDTNLPPVADQGVWERWMQEIHQSMLDLAAEGYARPCPANPVVFSNDCSHYLAIEQIGNDRDRLWIQPYTANSPRVPHPAATDMAARIMKAHAQRLAPPSESPDFQ